MRTSLLRLALVVVCLAAPARPAAADVAGAKAAFADGERLFKLGQFSDAIAAYERAFSLDARPAFLYNMALAHRRQFESDRDLAHLSRARALYRNYLLLEPQTSRRAAVEKLIAELTTQIDQEEERRAESTPAPPSPAPPPATIAPPSAVASPAPVSPATTPLVSASAPPPRSHHVGWIVGGTLGAALIVGGAIALGVVLSRPAPLGVDLTGTPR